MDVDFPYQFDSKGRTGAATGDDHVRDLLEQLLFTSPGERVNRPDFGTGIAQLVFAANSPELAAALQFALNAALSRWIGDLLEVRALAVTSEDSRLVIDLS